MKLEELMLGDLVIAANHDDEQEVSWPARISGLDENGTIGDGWQFTAEPLIKESSDTIDELRTIPLSEGIFERNGFVPAMKDGVCFALKTKKEDFEYIIMYDPEHSVEVTRKFPDPDGHMMCETVLFKSNVFFVHEMQHILRFVGLLELANNFKL